MYGDDYAPKNANVYYDNERWLLGSRTMAELVENTGILLLDDTVSREDLHVICKRVRLKKGWE